MAEQRRWCGRTGRARAWSALAAVATGALAAVVPPAGAASAGTVGAPTQTASFDTVGEHPFTVPLGVTLIHVVAIGGRGGVGYKPGGRGARVEADVRVSPGSTIYAEVGSDGANATFAKNAPGPGGANGGQPGGGWSEGLDAENVGAPPVSGAGGGGASDLQTCPIASCQPIDLGSGALLLVAAGGGGAGGASGGGDAGTPIGSDAAPAGTVWDIEVGTGATDTSSGSNYVRIAYKGPDAHCTGDWGQSFGGGGGGGGYYCGGGGSSVDLGGGGGGGSSYAPAGARYALATDAPKVTITYETAFRIAPASRSSLTLDGAGGAVTQQAPSGASSQLWRLVPQGSLYQIVNLASGQCVTTFGDAGGQLFLWPCWPVPQNLWQLPANFGAAANGSLIWNPAFDLYVDVYGGSTTAGGAIDAQPYNGGYADQYYLTFPG